MTPPPGATVPPIIDELTARYLEAVDQALPGFVQMLYLTGSAALGAWQPGHSDIDTLIVTSRVADVDDLAALAAIHAGMPSMPHLDGIYLDRMTFCEQAADRRVVPFVVNGEFRTDKPCGDLNPVLWLVLQRYGLPVRGPAVADFGLTFDRDALLRFNLDNLRTYWQPLAGEVRQFVEELADDAPVDAKAVAWVVHGPARLHYTLAFTDVISKSRAGAYLAENFPTWAPLADRATRWRAGEPVAFAAAELRAAASSVDAVADDAWNRWG